MRNRLLRRPVPDFPRTVQLETQTGCNADCVFCDYGISYPKQPKGKIDWELFRRIVDECSQYRVRRFSPYLTNEPFADKELLERIEYVNRKMPTTKVVVTTNAHYLVPDLTDRILALEKPLHAIYISFQGIEKEAYEATMRGNMKFERTMENVNHLVGRIQKEGRTFSYLLHDGPQVLRLTQNDVRAIQLAKAALYAGARLLMDHMGVENLDRITLAGAFGSHIDVKYAMILGMIPDRDLARVGSAGNAAGTGARIALLNMKSREEIARVVKQVEKVETAVEPKFQEHFVEAMAIPHKTRPYPHLSAVVRLPAPKQLLQAGDDEGGQRRRRRRS